MRRRLILVVDDEPPIVRLVKAKLQVDGFAVMTAGKGEEALPIVEHDRPDLVILDLMMPGMDGFETLRHIRERSRVPVIFLTARVGDVDKLRGLQSGADDYITKPFNPDELSARVTAVLRRSDGAAPAGGATLLEYSRVVIDLDRRNATLDGKEVKLSRTEWELLYQLASNAGRVMLHRELLSRIWGPEFTDEVQYLRTWVSRLRAKLDPDDTGELITTFPGVGYRMELPGAQR
jgi:two-component system KDP operon response regulator KdpE